MNTRPVTRQGKRLFVWLFALLLCVAAVRLAVYGSLL
jgi:hypothetical protein